VDGYNRSRAMDITEQIYARTLTIFDHAERDKIHTHQAAMNMAEKRLKDIAAVKTGM